MIKDFKSYLIESIGAELIGKDSVDLALHPHVRASSGLMLHAGTSGTIPTHWNNSPFLSGSRLTSAFGLNPRKDKKKKVLSYYDFIKSVKKLSKK